MLFFPYFFELVPSKWGASFFFLVGTTLFWCFFFFFFFFKGKQTIRRRKAPCGVAPKERNHAQIAFPGIGTDEIDPKTLGREGFNWFPVNHLGGMDLNWGPAGGHLKIEAGIYVHPFLRGFQPFAFM